MAETIFGGQVAAIGECMVELSGAPGELWSLSWGGDTLNTAVYLARLGVPVAYVTALGDDPFSTRMLAGWTDEGIDTGRVARLPGRMPGLYAIETDAAGERSFHYWRGEAAARDLVGTLDPDAAFKGAGVVFLSGITLAVVRPDDRPVLFGHLDKARTNGTAIVFDTNLRPRMWPDRAEAVRCFRRAIGLSDLVFTTLEDLAGLGVAQDVEEARRWLRAETSVETVLRIAPDRCEVAPAGEAFRSVLLPPPVPAADTTGAGDSFDAGYLAARRAGQPPEAAVAAADRIARVVVTHRGAIAPRAAADWPARLAAEPQMEADRR